MPPADASHRPRLRPPGELAELAGGQAPLDQVLVLRLHQVVQSVLTIYPERAPLMHAALAALAADLAPVRRRPRGTPVGVP